MGVALAATVATGGALVRLGGLGVPLTDSGDLQAWVDDTAPATIAAGLLRIVAIALCGYLTVALVAAGIAALAERYRDIPSSAIPLLPSALRHLLVSASGIGLAGTAMPLAAPTSVLAATPSGDDDVAVMVKLAPDEDSPTTSVADVPGPQDPLPGEAATVGPEPEQPEEDPAPENPLPEQDPTEGNEAEGAATWIVTPGDSFWSIAEETLAERAAAKGYQQPPDDAAISAYWFELITANRDLLAHPDDPDLLFSGQALRLPPT